MTNGGGQGPRMQQRRTSSRWMACSYFLSNPRPISSIARKVNVTSLSIKSAIGSTPLVSGIPDRRGHGSVRRVAGRNELRPYRPDGAQQDSFIYNDYDRLARQEARICV